MTGFDVECADAKLGSRFSVVLSPGCSPSFDLSGIVFRIVLGCVRVFRNVARDVHGSHHDFLLKFTVKLKGGILAEIHRFEGNIYVGRVSLAENAEPAAVRTRTIRVPLSRDGNGIELQVIGHLA